MTKKGLKIVFTESYQLYQAASYLAKMFNKDSTLNIEYFKDEKNVLKLKVPSRHISQTRYKCFLRYNPNSIEVSGLTNYAYESANGRRTVDFCSHIAAIVYYLSYARYLLKNFKPAEILIYLFKNIRTAPRRL